MFTISSAVIATGMSKDGKSGDIILGMCETVLSLVVCLLMNSQSSFPFYGTLHIATGDSEHYHSGHIILDAGDGDVGSGGQVNLTAGKCMPFDLSPHCVLFHPRILICISLH